MDPAVALVETYLRVNGYFTVTEFPVVEAARYGGFQAATDLDVLAFRFPRAGRLVAGTGHVAGSHSENDVYVSDPALGAASEQVDMVIGEVKEGRAELNRGARDPAVLQAVLARFGCCEEQHVPGVVKRLLQTGCAETHCGHRVRLVAFGSIAASPEGHHYAVISLGHVLEFLQSYIREHGEVLCPTQFKDPLFGFLVMAEKTCRGRGISVH